jgi:hypothetical protein
MNARKPSGPGLQSIVSLLLACLLAACGGPVPAGGPYVWIDAPTDGLRVPVGQPVQIEGHASYTEGIASIEVWVNGGLLRVEENPPSEGNLAHFGQSWMPPGPGDYTIQVVAIAADGSGSAPDFARVYVGEEVPAGPQTPEPVTPTLSPTSSPTVIPTVAAIVAPTFAPAVTPTLTRVSPIPGPVIQFWADAEQVDAGSCISLHWHAENVQAVFFDGAGVVGDGSHQTCPCEDETHTLAVTLTDGSQERRSITIRVSGSCTAIPTPDTTAPPAPPPVLPKPNAELGCSGEVTLDWDPVSDPSGIAEYRVEVESHTGDGKWKPLPDSPWRGVTTTELEIQVSCGIYYRWRVRAIDGAGNQGPFSPGSEFSVVLM